MIIKDFIIFLDAMINAILFLYTDINADKEDYMLNKLAKYLLTASSVAPVFFTLAFLSYISKHYKFMIAYLSLGKVRISRSFLPKLTR